MPRQRFQLFRRHVRQRAAEPILRQGLFVGQVKVDQHRLAVGADEDVGRLQVAVEEAALVNVGEGVGQPLAHVQNAVEVAAAAQGPGGRGGAVGRPAVVLGGGEQDVGPLGQL